jgi:hypothetical protein
MAELVGAVLEVVVRLLFGIVIGCFVALPVFLIVFVYGLSVGRSFSEAVRAAGEAGASIVGEIASHA